ncbi:MAG: SGNH/GDSL hydrolase family protein [Planctomycetota bacterium]
MNHIVLLGDSIFDNAVYVHQERGEEPVINQLQTRISPEWTATLVAHDGDVVRSVKEQLKRMPKGASHLVISVGGNNALVQGHILQEPARSMGEALANLARTKADFRRDYREMLQSVCALGKPAVVCTVYDQFSLFNEKDVPGGHEVLLAALSVFNDVIIDEAVRARIPVLDLRRICDQSTDYSDISPIEPSASGSAKIAKAILRIVATHDFSRRQTVVFGKELLAEGK